MIGQLRMKNGTLIRGIVIGAVGILLLGAAVVLILTLLGPRSGAVFNGQIANLRSSGETGAGGGEQPAAFAPPASDMTAVSEEKAGDIAISDGSRVTSNDAQAIDRLIIRTGNVNLSVEKTLEAEAKITGVVNQFSGEGAFLVSSSRSESGYEGSPYIQMSIRVPADHFDEVMQAITVLAAPGTTPTVSQSAQDVTDQYVDINARLESLEAARKRLLEIMSESQNSNDLLLAEQYLTQREAEIESLKGQKQYLEQSAALSSITISLQPYIVSQPIDTGWNPGRTFRESIDALLNNLRNFGDWLIHFAVVDLAGWVVWGVILFFGGQFAWRRFRKWQGKQAAQASSAAEEN